MSDRKRITILVILGVMVVAVYMYSEFTRGNKKMTELTSVASVNAVDILKEFMDNDSIANKKYLGKVITVSGMVKKVEKDESGNETVFLGDTSSLSSVRCSMDIIINSTPLLAERGVVQIKGNCTGYNEDDLLGSDLVLNRCIVVHKP